ncbi:MAG: hypothetical protein BGO98_27200 [Myxococcales bacterium 68-20]|nr:hypothetical protein [Myxococcales bacterium]OJY30412.1 MAG: hypothetical protein BGO98_27200 [Myxococcales bacterium 68-20]
MKRVTLVTAVFGAAALAAFVACADSGVSDGPEPVPSENEGGAPSPEAGPDADDAGDASLDPDPPRECTREGYCHTTLPKGLTLRGVWSDGAGVTWAVSEQGAILRYENKAWAVHATVTGPLRAIWGSGPTNIWIGGDSGLFHGEGGSSAKLAFTAVDTPPPKTPITSIWGASATDVWAAGNNNTFPILGRVLHYTGATVDDAGAVPEWSLEEVSRAPIFWARVFGSAANGIWVAGEWFNPAMGSRREVMIMRRSPGTNDWVQERLPQNPSLPNDPRGDFEHLYDAAVSSDGASMWVLGKTHGSVPAFAMATTANGAQSFDWSFGVTSTKDDPYFNAIGAIDTDRVFIVGDYSRLRTFDGVKWKQAVISVSKYPLTAPFYAMGGKPDDLWFVGEDIALHRDVTKIQPRAKR